MTLIYTTISASLARVKGALFQECLSFCGANVTTSNTDLCTTDLGQYLYLISFLTTKKQNMFLEVLSHHHLLQIQHDKLQACSSNPQASSSSSDEPYIFLHDQSGLARSSTDKLSKPYEQLCHDTNVLLAQFKTTCSSYNKRAQHVQPSSCHSQHMCIRG